eukprot:m.69537 g.69537  ORF g.69537 m.69537 type:complete len:111 (-) comp50074_c0_seq1:2534-2866(-)
MTSSSSTNRYQEYVESRERTHLQYVRTCACACALLKSGVLSSENTHCGSSTMCFKYGLRLRHFLGDTITSSFHFVSSFRTWCIPWMWEIRVTLQFSEESLHKPIDQYGPP